MNDEEIKQLCDMNFKASMLLGMATVLIEKLYRYGDEDDKGMCNKFFNDINKLYYGEA